MVSAMMLNNRKLMSLMVAFAACGVMLGAGCSRAPPPPQAAAAAKQNSPPPTTTQQAGAAPKQDSPQAAAPQQAATPSQSGGAAPVAGTTQATWAPDALEQLLAPIALYPDQLVGQILAASVNSQEVLDAGNWLLENQNLQGDALDAAASKAGFGPAMRALVRFPTVVDMMCQNIDWTRQLGSAFTSDQKAVLDAVQRLRVQAEKVGNLKSTPEQKVETRTEDNKTVVEVKPADPQVVYVPQYNPQAVYTTPPPPAPAESTSHDEGTVSTETAVGAGLLGFGTGVLLGSALNHDDDCCYPSWGASSVYVGARPFYAPAYAYRPAYGAGFRPAYGYNRPAGYRYGYDNARVSGNRNVNVNNNNYFNQFNRNQNLRTGAAAGGWKGQSAYAGARNPAVNERRLNQAVGSAPGARATRPGGAGNPNQTRQGAGAGARAGPEAGARTGAGAGSAAGARAGAGQRAGAGAGAGATSGRALPADRGYGASTPRAGAGQGAARGTGQLSRPADTGTSRSGAFGGARGSEGGGSFDRASSARGRSSAGGRSFGGGGGARGGGRRR
jgi:Protein of unknown function (DUF3300)